jgi:hypothetical protein
LLQPVSHYLFVPTYDFVLAFVPSLLIEGTVIGEARLLKGGITSQCRLHIWPC